jgi:hypothetical protein
VIEDDLLGPMFGRMDPRRRTRGGAGARRRLMRPSQRIPERPPSTRRVWPVK